MVYYGHLFNWADEFYKTYQNFFWKLTGRIPGCNNHYTTDHHPQQGFSVLLVSRPEDRVRRINWRSLQHPCLIVEPKADLNSQVASEYYCCVATVRKGEFFIIRICPNVGINASNILLNCIISCSSYFRCLLEV